MEKEKRKQEGEVR